MLNIAQILIHVSSTPTVAYFLVQRALSVLIYLTENTFGDAVASAECYNQENYIHTYVESLVQLYLDHIDSYTNADSVSYMMKYK